MFFFSVAAFVGGVLALQMMAVLPPVFVVGVVPVLAAVVFLLRDRRRVLSGGQSVSEKPEQTADDKHRRTAGDTHWQVVSASGKVLTGVMISEKPGKKAADEKQGAFDKTTGQAITAQAEQDSAGVSHYWRFWGLHFWRMIFGRLYLWHRAFGLLFWRRVLLLLLCAVAGFCWALVRAEWRLDNQLPPPLEWRDIIVEGQVRGFAKTDARASRFLFDIERVISPHPQQLALRARLAFYHNDKPPPSFLIDGAKLRLKVRIRPPRESANPHGFDYAGWLFAGNIRAAGYVRGGGENKGVVVLREGGGLRHSLSSRAWALLAEDKNNGGALLAALVVGDRSQMTEEQWRVLRRTGTAHLFAISGAHLSIAAGFAAFLVAFLWRRSQRLTGRMPAQKAALLVSIPMAFAYALLAGMEVPVQRSFVMLTVAAVAVLAGGISRVFYAIAFAAMVIVAWDPWSVLSAGFWLSFAFVAALAAVVMRGRRGLLRRLVAAQFLLSLCAMPLTLWFFNQASLISPLANLAAIPVIGFVVLPLALADIIMPGDMLWKIAGFVLSNLWEGLAYLSDAPFAAWQPASPPGGLFVLAVVGAALLLMPSGFPMRFAGVLPILAMLLWQPAGVSHGGFRAVILDVGQGAAVVIKTENRYLLYDTGAGYAFPAVRDYLRGEGARRLDMLMVSHNDRDHSGGARAALAEFDAARVLASWRMADVAGFSLCRAGQRWEWDGVVFSVLYPDDGEYAGKGVSDNDKSCVLHIKGEGESLLLTGDISADAERVLLSRYDGGEGNVLRAAVVNAPHHGSRFSSSPEFIDAVRPDVAIFSSGADNRFNHPHPQVVGAYQKFGATIFRTDRDGAIIMNFPAKGKHKITGWRKQSLHYWHRQRGDR
ncbi:MAG: DNA internalization-related competence protein ComEC/Rec2 [Gammaproteobacteria bacterium]